MSDAALNSSSHPVDVFVAGGGPAGLATAIAARLCGLSVVLADGAVPPIDKPCGEGLMPDGVEALHDLGVSVSECEAYPFQGIRFFSSGLSAEAAFPGRAALGVRRTNLHRALLDRAAACGVRMLWRTAVTGLHPEGALLAGELLRARWIVGADGGLSRVRCWARLDRQSWKTQTPASMRPRFGFRQHYRVEPWTEFMELHWGRQCQVYVTPVSREEVCVALISSDSKLRLESQIKNPLREFPELLARLKNAELTSRERGTMTITRRLPRVYRGRTALVGDASGSVDAITGDGLSLAFRQALLLADCLKQSDLARYQQCHRNLLRRPTLMSHLMLFMGNHSGVRRRSMQVFQSMPRTFAGMLALHVGEGRARDHLSNGIAFGWSLLKA
jgi:2-polyprenyl-6-methoxyphenol hydroxylase-like FAD-dependent oxidoreductase